MGEIHIINPPEFLRDFTDPDGPAFYLQRINVLNNRFIATNAHIAAWCDTPGPVEDSSGLPKEFVEGVPGLIAAQESVEIPDNAEALKTSAAAIMESFEQCSACKGRGRLMYEECSECDGDGTCPRCGHECEECEGRGKVMWPGSDEPCEDCFGTGKRMRTVLLNGHGIRGDYLALLVRHRASVGPVFTMRKNQAHPFQFLAPDGSRVRGFVMPVSRPSDPILKIDWPAIDLFPPAAT